MPQQTYSLVCYFATILILLMINRFYPPPEFGSRPMTFAKLGKGKRHYWGQKGKSYGLFTSSQQQDMAASRKKHRRIKSQINNYSDEINPQKLRRSGSAVIRENAQNDYASNHYHRINTENEVQAEEMNAKRKQLSTSTPLNIKQRLQSYVSNHREDEQQEQNLHSHNKSFLPKISEKRANIQQTDNQYQERGEEYQQRGNIQQSRIVSINRQPVVYYRRKSRLDNPTFCNSYGYPLPCHRYI